MVLLRIHLLFLSTVSVRYLPRSGVVMNLLQSPDSHKLRPQMLKQVSWHVIIPHQLSFIREGSCVRGVRDCNSSLVNCMTKYDIDCRIEKVMHSTSKIGLGRVTHLQTAGGRLGNQAFVSASRCIAVDMLRSCCRSAHCRSRIRGN